MVVLSINGGVSGGGRDAVILRAARRRPPGVRVPACFLAAGDAVTR